MRDIEPAPEPVATRGSLPAARATTGAAMVVERLWPLFLPLSIVASLYVSASWFGVFRLVPEWARLALGAAFALAGLAALYPLKHMRWPRRDDIDRRIEAVNALAHAPITVQDDRLTGRETSFATALWREHQRRMAARLRDLGGDLPRTRVPERDPWGLRALAPLLLVAAFAFSFGPLGGRLDDALHERLGAPAVPPRIDAWVTPPAYTKRPPIFLTGDPTQLGAAYTVPEGSEIALRVTNGSGGETLAFTDINGTVREITPPDAQKADASAKAGQSQAGAASSALPRQFSGRLTTDGTLALKDGDKPLKSWTFAVTPDKPPTIRFIGEPKQALNGTLELNYEILDDYGAASAEAEFALADTPKPDAHPLYKAPELPLALPRRNGDGKSAKVTRDLTEHAWAGSSVTLRLKVTDDAGHEALSEPKSFILPEKPFNNPLARAVIEDRRLISLDARDKGEVLNLIDAITLRPEDTFDNMSNYLGLMAGRTQLELATTDDEMRGVADYFWQMALAIENGALSDAQKRLKQAQENLKQALEKGASDEELDKLMKELRQAMDDYMRELAEQAQKNPSQAQQTPQNGKELRESDLRKMLDQIEKMAKSGNKDQAQQLLSQLEDMMNNLQAGQGQQNQQDGQGGEMKKQMDKLGEIMRRQQQMMNETFGLGQQQRGEQGEQDGMPQMGQDGSGQQPGDREGDGQQDGGQKDGGQKDGGMTPQEFADALKQLQEGQGQLQKDLQGLTKQLGRMGIKPGEGFGDAEDAMGEAEGALGQSDGERATGEQGRALEALRRGAQDMMKQMMQAMQGDKGGSEQGGREQSADRDPLGRPRATTGPDFGDSVKVPDEIDVQRARQILDAIRKRLGNALSPDIERSYLERLLQMN